MKKPWRSKKARATPVHSVAAVSEIARTVQMASGALRPARKPLEDGSIASSAAASYSIRSIPAAIFQP